MKLSAIEAKRCIGLLDAIDMYVLENYNVVKKGSTIYLDEINEFRVKLRNHWQNHPTIIDDFIADNKKLSIEDRVIVRNWKNIKREPYLIIKHYHEYSVFASAKGDRFYGALALTDDFNDVLPMKPPLLIETSLLPYKGQIVWDGLASVSVLNFGKNMTNTFLEECEKRRNNGEIKTSF